MHHPVIELKQPNGQTYEKAGHQRKDQGQMTMRRCALERKALMLISQATYKQNPTNAQVTEANMIPQVQHEE